MLHQTTQGLHFRKINRRKDEIRNYMTSNATPITDVVYHESDLPEDYQTAMKATDYKPIRVGEHWNSGKNAWFKLKFTVPKEFKGKQVAAFLNFGGEACAFVDGKTLQGIDGNHEELLLLEKAKGGEKFEIAVDVVSGSWWNPGGGTTEFSRAELATRSPEVQEYWFNLETLYLLAEQLTNDTPRQVKIIRTLSKSVDSFDYTHTDEGSVRKSAIRANEILKPLLECPANASATNVAVHGHAHIDVAWLWPYWETKRKCSRTFSSVINLMKQYPDYIFSQSQAQLYEFTKENYPALYEEIKKRAKEGRWDVTGSSWVEMDCNLSSGESLVRQLLVGKNFFKDEFGEETDVLWLPDVFGYSAALPQILQKSGVPYFSTIKISWNQFNPFPYNTFYWQGIDGSKVLAHFPPTGDYNAYTDPSKLLRQVHEFKEKDRCDESLLSYGWGDGGGGPDRRHLEFLNRYKDLEGLPRCRQKRVTDFFHSIDQDNEYPEWAGELYLELHRGTYTTQAKNKWYNRKCELLYRDAEFLGSIARPLGFDYPYDELLREWKKILCNQFHDVIPGSSIRQVYEDTDQMYAQVVEVGKRTVSDAQSKIAESIDTSGDGLPIVVFNSLSWGRDDLAEATAPAKLKNYTVVDPQGSEVPWQQVGDTVYFQADVPSMGYSVYRFVEKKPAKFANALKASKRSMQNKYYKIALDAKGVISSIVHKETGREMLPEGRRANLLQLFEDKPIDWPAWDIDFFYDDKWEDITDVQSIEVVEQGPVRAALEITRKFNNSSLKQKIIIYADNPRIDFETWVDWHEKQKVLKASFPVDVNTTKARYEIQFGNVERPTHTNTSWDKARFEVCAHKWADISEQGFGMSLMNDCKYGHHTKGTEMRLTLLRSAIEPDPVADIGEHNFTYSIMPHSGNYIDAGTVKQAYQLNVPMPSFVAKASKGSQPTEKSFVTVSADNVILEAVKKAEKEDATILRFYECHNTRGRVDVELNLPFKKVFECDLMEADIEQVESTKNGFSFDIKPFEIKTFKLK